MYKRQFIHNAGIAKTAVQACSYPDTGGIRGQGPIRAIRYGLLDEGEYLASGYRNVMRIMQIESLEGYENLDAIMDVEGIDSIFIGAADLSRSIAGYRGDKNYTPVSYTHLGASERTVYPPGGGQRNER